MQLLISFQSTSGIYSEYDLMFFALFDSLEERAMGDAEKAANTILNSIKNRKTLISAFEEYVEVKFKDGIEDVAEYYSEACKLLNIQQNLRIIKIFVKYFSPTVDDIGNILKPPVYKNDILLRKLVRNAAKSGGSAWH